MSNSTPVLSPRAQELVNEIRSNFEKNGFPFQSWHETEMIPSHALDELEALGLGFYFREIDEIIVHLTLEGRRVFGMEEK